MCFSGLKELAKTGPNSPAFFVFSLRGSGRQCEHELADGTVFGIPMKTHR